MAKAKQMATPPFLGFLECFRPNGPIFCQTAQVFCLGASDFGSAPWIRISADDGGALRPEAAALCGGRHGVEGAGRKFGGFVRGEFGDSVNREREVEDVFGQ